MRGKGQSLFAKSHFWIAISLGSGNCAGIRTQPILGRTIASPMPRTFLPALRRFDEMKKPIYFDYNATTPLDPGVREAMLPFLGETFGNPSSVHQVGRRARALLDDARDRASIVLQCKPSEVIFTSGGTESVNLAIFGTARLLKSKGRHIITSAVEHHAVLHSCQY